MLNTLFPRKHDARTKAFGPSAAIKLQTAVSRAITTLRRDVSEYGVDLKATYGVDHLTGTGPYRISAEECDRIRATLAR